MLSKPELYDFDVTYWSGKRRLRQLVSSADDLCLLYMNLGILINKLASEPYNVALDKCICIKLKVSSQ